MAKHNEVPVDDTVRPTPGKKNTKLWCKGKVGRPHRLSKRLSTKYVHRGPCHAMTPGESFPWSGDKDWSCDHEEYCEACGKVTQWFIRKVDCPVYQETH